MNDNVVHISNTPIFDQLARERGYDRLVSGGATVRLRPDDKCYNITPGAWIAKALPRFSQPIKGRNARLTVNFHPLDVEGRYESVSAFVEARKKEFGRKHPNAVDVVMESVEEIDGTFTLTIAGYENTGVMLTKLSSWEPKTDPIPEELAGNQLALYRAMTIDQSTIEINPEPVEPQSYDDMLKAFAQYTPEQTDETVNAASTDVTPRPQYAGPRPLWLIEDADADEE